MKMKHTPGPWIYGPETGPDCTRIDAENGRVIAAVRSREITSWEQSRPIYSWSEEGAANARLIAAAPDLFDFASLVSRMTTDSEMGGNMSGDDAAQALSELIETARAAIAKATGSV